MLNLSTDGSKQDQAELRIKEQVYWAKHSWMIFLAPRDDIRRGDWKDHLTALYKRQFKYPVGWSRASNLNIDVGFPSVCC